MVRLFVTRETVDTYPEHVSIFQVSLRMSLLSVDEVRKFGRVTDEEDGCVIEHPVPVTLVSL